MKSVTCSLLFMAFAISAPGQTGKSSNEFKWRRATPESVGVSSDKLGHLAGNLERQRTHKLVIIKNDRIIFEWYAPDHEGLDKNHYCASMSKSLVSGLSLLLALNEQYIFPDAPACHYIPEWKKDGQKSKITIRQLATHTSGLDDSEGSSEEQLALKQKGLDRHMDLKGPWSR